MPEESALICKPVASPGYVVPGSLPSKCSQCGQPVWVAPSSWLLLYDSPTTAILCMACASANMAKHKVKIQELIPAQMEEIEKYRKRGNNATA